MWSDFETLLFGAKQPFSAPQCTHIFCFKALFFFCLLHAFYQVSFSELSSINSSSPEFFPYLKDLFVEELFCKKSCLLTGGLCSSFLLCGCKHTQPSVVGTTTGCQPSQHGALEKPLWLAFLSADISLWLWWPFPCCGTVPTSTVVLCSCLCTLFPLAISSFLRHCWLWPHILLGMSSGWTFLSPTPKHRAMEFVCFSLGGLFCCSFWAESCLSI